MRRPGYLIAAVVLAVIVLVFWFVLFSHGWVERTGWVRDETGASEAD